MKIFADYEEDCVSIKKILDNVDELQEEYEEVIGELQSWEDNYGWVLANDKK